MRRIYQIIFLSLCLSSCVREGPAVEFSGRTGPRTVSLSISGDALPAYGTRSSVTAGENGLGTIDIFFYHSGSLCSDLTFSGNAGWSQSYTVDVELDGGKSYDVLVLANSNVHTAPAKYEDALKSLKYVSEGISGWNSGGIPMAGRTSFTAGPAMSDITVRLERLVSRFTLDIDTSGLEHGSIEFSSVAVRQMNKVCPFFSSATATYSGGVCDGDLASPDEIEAMNASGGYYSMTFYLTENLQGELLRNNDDPDLKIPQEVVKAGGDPSLCTYIEILGRYSDSSGMMTGEPLTARFFLGDDATSSFDIRRNSLYEVELRITDSACLRADWKIDGNISDRRTLSFTSASSAMEAGESLYARLETNLSYARGDYSYTVNGDINCFSVKPYGGATSFLVSSTPSAPDGAVVEIVAASWDGRLVTSHRVSVQRSVAGEYSISWKEDGGVLYVAQKRELEIRDRNTGAYPSETVSISASKHRVSVLKSGSSWVVSALYSGDETLEVKVGGELVAEVPVSVTAPLMRFSADEIFLPIDGAMVMAGPYYYKTDGQRLNYEDFDPDLYYDLLDVSLQRSVTASQAGRYWRAAGSGGNPAVALYEMTSDYYSYGLRMDRLSDSGCGIADNYDFSGGTKVYLESIRAFPCDMGTGVVPAETLLYTMDPFISSKYLGARESWALARWPQQSVHDESFSFTIGEMVRPGNDSSYAGAIYPFSGENKYEFSFRGLSTVEMKVLYAGFSASAMPEKYFTFAPVMRNRNSGEYFMTAYRYNVDFTVNLSMGAVAADNGAGGCDIQVEWAFPRQDAGLLASIENKAVACTASGSTSAAGMYKRLYSVYGYTPANVRSFFSPEYCLVDLETGSRLNAGSYHVPESYGLGYDLVLWKYGSLYPSAGGWLVK